MRLDEMGGEESPGGVVAGIIAPESVRDDQIRGLLLDPELVIIILGPFLGRIRRSIKILYPCKGYFVLIKEGLSPPALILLGPALIC